MNWKARVTDAGRLARIGAGFGIVAAAIPAGVANADPWTYELALTVGGTYSDNIGLAEDGLEQSETVYQLSPELTLSKDGERVDALVNYAPQALFYENTSDADEIYHVLDAEMQTVLVRESLFVDFSAVNFQTVGDSEGRFPTSNIPILGQRVDTAIWSVTPRWQHQLGRAQIVAQAGWRDTSFSDTETTTNVDTLDSVEKTGSFRVDNYAVEQGLSWAVNYEYVRIEYDGEAIPWEYQQASAELGFWVSGNLRVFAGGGRETPFDSFLDPAMDADFWELGFDYKPNERLELELAAGERSFGTSLRGRMAYRYRRGESVLTYSEEPATQNMVLSGRRPLLQSDNLDEFLNRLDNEDQFIRKRAEWRSTFDLPKSSITLRLFREERDESFTRQGAPSADESYHGGALRFDWNVGAKLSLGAFVDVADREREASEDTLTRFGISASYRLTRRLGLQAQAQHSDEESEGFGFNDYTESQYGLFLTMDIL